jgi:putative ABC transport system permease protein
MIAMGVLFGAPVGYLLGTVFLQSFAYQISISPMLVVFALMFIVFLTVLVIASQTLRAAIVNPLSYLKDN